MMFMNHNNITLAMLLVAVIAICAPKAHSDTLTLTNGDHLTGTLLNISDGTLSFRTTLAGRIFVPTEEIDQISTTSFVVVALKNDQLVPGRIVTLDQNIYVVPPNNDRRIPLKLADISGVSSAPASSEESGGEVPPNGIQVTAGVGYKWRDGTKDSSGPVAEINLDAKLKKVDIESYAEFEYTRDAHAFDRFFDAEVRMRGIGDAPFQPQVIVELQRDRNQALESRTDVTVGAQGTIIDNDKQHLEGFAGLGVAFEKYDSHDLRKDQNALPQPPPGEPSVTDQDLNLNLAVRYSRQWYRQTTIEKELVVRPGLSDAGDLRAELKSTLAMPLPLGMQLRLNVDLNYDNQSPYKNIDNWNSSFGASMRFDF
jgi:Protein of unknown function, DUF481